MINAERNFLLNINKVDYKVLNLIEALEKAGVEYSVSYPTDEISGSIWINGMDTDFYVNILNFDYT